MANKPLFRGHQQAIFMSLEGPRRLNARGSTTGNVSWRPSVPLRQSPQQVMETVHPNWLGRPAVPSVNGDVTAPSSARPGVRYYDDVQGYFKQILLSSGLHQERNYWREYCHLQSSGGVNNDFLEEAYKQKMEELRICGVGLQEQILFAAFDDESAAENVLRHGLFCKNDAHNQKEWIEDLGTLSAGIYLSRHADLLAMRRIGQKKFFIVIFKVYLFDWDMRNPGHYAMRPRQCLPVGYVEVQRHQGSAGHHPGSNVTAYPNAYLSPTTLFLPPAQTALNGAAIAAATVPNLPTDATIHSRQLPQQQQQPLMTYESQPPPAYSNTGPHVQFTRQFPAQLAVDVTSQQMRQTLAAPAAAAAFTVPLQVQLSPQNGQLASPVSQPRDARRAPPCLKGPYTAPFASMTSSCSYVETNARPTASIPDMPSSGIADRDQCQQLNPLLELQQLLLQQQQPQRQEQPSSRSCPLLSSLVAAAPTSAVSRQPSASQPLPPPSVAPTIKANACRPTLYHHRPQLLQQPQQPLPVERSNELQMQSGCIRLNVPLHQNVLAQPFQTSSMTSANDAFSHVVIAPTLMSGCQSTGYRPPYASASQVCAPPVGANATSQFLPTAQCTSNVVGNGPSSAPLKGLGQPSVEACHQLTVSVPNNGRSRKPTCEAEAVAPHSTTAAAGPVPDVDVSRFVNPVVGGVKHADDSVGGRHEMNTQGSGHVPVAGTNSELPISPRVLPSFDDVRKLFDLHRRLVGVTSKNISIVLIVCIRSIDNARQGQMHDHPCLKGIPNVHQLHIDLTDNWPKTEAFAKYFELNRSILQASQLLMNSGDLLFLQNHVQFVTRVKTASKRLLKEKLWTCLMTTSNMQLDMRLAEIADCSRQVLDCAKYLIYGVGGFVKKLYKYAGAGAQTSNNRQPQSSSAGSSPAVAVDAAAVPVANCDKETVQTGRRDRPDVHLEREASDVSAAADTLPDVETQCQEAAENSATVGNTQLLTSEPTSVVEGFDRQVLSRDSPVDTASAGLQTVKTEVREDDVDIKPTFSRHEDLQPLFVDLTFVDDDDDDDVMTIFYRSCPSFSQLVKKENDAAGGPSSPNSAVLELSEVPPRTDLLATDSSQEETAAAVATVDPCVSVDDLIREVIARDVNVPATTNACDGGDVVNEYSPSVLLKSASIFSAGSGTACQKVKVEEDMVITIIPDELSAEGGATDEQVSPPSADECSATRVDLPCSQNNIEQKVIPLSEKDQFSPPAGEKLAGTQFKLSKKWVYVSKAADEPTVKIEGDNSTWSASGNAALPDHHSAGDDTFVSFDSNASVADRNAGFPKTEPDDVTVTVEPHAIVHLKIEPTNFDRSEEDPRPEVGQAENLPGQIPPVITDSVSDQMSSDSRDIVGDGEEEEAGERVATQTDFRSPVPVSATTACDDEDNSPVAAESECEADSDDDDDQLEQFYNPKMYQGVWRSPAVHRSSPMDNVTETSRVMSRPAEKCQSQPEVMERVGSPDVMECRSSPEVEAVDAPEVMERVDSPDVIELLHSSPLSDDQCYRTRGSSPCYSERVPADGESSNVDCGVTVEGQTTEDENLERELLTAAVSITATSVTSCCRYETISPATVVSRPVEFSQLYSGNASDVYSCVEGDQRATGVRDVEPEVVAVAAAAAENTARDDDGCRCEAISPAAVVAESISGIDSESAGYFSSDSSQQSPHVNDESEGLPLPPMKNSIFSELNGSIRVAKRRFVEKLLQIDKVLHTSDGGKLTEYADDFQTKDSSIRRQLDMHRKIRDQLLTWKSDKSDSRMRYTYNDLAAKHMPISWQCRHRPEVVIVLPKELRLESEKNVDVGKEVTMVLAPSRGISAEQYVRLHALTEVIEKTARDDVNYKAKQNFLHDKRKALLKTICCSTEPERLEVVETLKERLAIYSSVEQRSEELTDQVRQMKYRVRRHVTMLDMFTVDDCGNWTQRTDSSDHTNNVGHGEQNAPKKDTTSRSNSEKGNANESPRAVQSPVCRTSRTDTCSEKSNRPRLVLSIVKVKQTPLAEPKAAATSIAVNSDSGKKKKSRKEKNHNDQPAAIVLAKVNTAAPSGRLSNLPDKNHIKTKHVDRGGSTNALRDATVRHGDNNCHKKQTSNKTDTGKRNTTSNREESASSVKPIVRPVVTSARVKHPSSSSTSSNGDMNHISSVSGSSHKRKLPPDTAATVAPKKVREEQVVKPSVASPTGQKIGPLPFHMKKIPKLTFTGAQHQYERTSLENSLYHRSQGIPQRLGT